MASDRAVEVQQQYAVGDIWARIDAAIRSQGKDPADLSLDDVASLEEFHIGGRQATVELAQLAGFTPGSRVVDVGAGLGGPARLLASRFDCEVTAVDLTPEYCHAAEMLNQATGLGARVTVRQANALDLPFVDGEFDGAWTQHASMNIEDKERLYAEVRRVIKTGAIFALHDVHAGPVQPLVFPVPWADTSSVSFLATPEQTRRDLLSAGFEVIEWRDRTREAVEFFKTWAAAAQRPAMGVHVYVPDLAEKSRNQVQNFECDRLRVSLAVVRAV